MFNNTKKIQNSIYEATGIIKNKIDIFVQQINSLMNKQEVLLKAINEDRLIITKILQYLEKTEKQNKNNKREK